jgi:hypothetical protein
VASLLIPKVSPPTPKKNTRNKPLRRPEEIPSARAIPPNTPPSHLSVAFLVIVKVREIQIFVSLVKKTKKNESVWDSFPDVGRAKTKILGYRPILKGL